VPSDRWRFASSDGKTCEQRYTENNRPEIVVLLPGSVPLILKQIPAGVFEMGSSEGEVAHSSDETKHQALLTQDYYLGKYEVAQKQWVALMGSNPSSNCGDYGIGDAYPVYCVSWNDICGTGATCGVSGGFIKALNDRLAATGQPGAGKFRLPTEAEWERAARAETSTRFSHGEVLECGGTCESCATHEQHMWWCGDNTPNGIKSAGQKLANPWGLFDMHGNVWEWVNDWYGSYLSDPQTNPPGPATGADRVIRGGSWGDGASDCRSARRSHHSPDYRSYAVGFRLARSQ
jgi:formylglycine-generating enzyme required for sulfatase activity